MAFRQYTQCVQPGDYSDFGFNTIGILNIIGMMIGGGLAAYIIAAIAGGPVGLAIAIAEMIVVVAFLHWWLNGRLICLNKEPCFIGMVRGVHASNPAPPPWGKMGDNDFTMNVLLAPGPTGFRRDFRDANEPVPPVSDYQGALQGDLVSPQSSISAIFQGYAADEGHVEYVTAIHCEFEGSGIRNLLIYAGIVLALLIAALAAWAIPGLGWLSTVLILLALVLGGAGLLNGLALGPGAAGAGDPTDISEDLKDLAAGDIVVVRGTWIYDSLHDGWNEIHPVKDCCIIKPAAMAIRGAWPPGFTNDAEVQAQLDLWCPMIQDAHDCEDGGSRDDPKNDWILHPLVDGCSDVIIT